MSARTVICLLRQDLRLHDHEVFHWAQSHAEHIVPLYCFDPRHYLGTAVYNLPRTGPFRLRFLLDSIRDLRSALLKKGSTLVVRRGRPEEVVADLVRSLPFVSAVVFHQEVASEERAVEQAVMEVCAQMKVKVHTCWGSTLYHRDDLPFPPARLPDVYTQFRKAVETQSRVRPLFLSPDQVRPLPPGLEEGDVPTLEELGQTGKGRSYILSDPHPLLLITAVQAQRISSQLPSACRNCFLSSSLDGQPAGGHVVFWNKAVASYIFNANKRGSYSVCQMLFSDLLPLLSIEPVSDPRSAFPCSGGESQVLARLKHYFWDTDSVASYKETRNGLVGVDYSTKFSPWLALGCISPRYIYHQVRQYESERTANQSTYWVIFELLWRDYFKFVGVKYGNRLFHLKGLQDKSVPWKKDMTLYNAWKDGRTGIPFVDANMREMAMTGFMSNRGRQNVASFLTKDLGLDWRMGAEWFEYLLVDHDVCSNYGNWLYSAGLGNDPRENRKFNMIKQGLDYDADGDYVRRWVPELQGLGGGEVHAPWNLGPSALNHAQVTLGTSYPHPVVMAPEWSRHTGRKAGGRQSDSCPSARGKKGPSHTPKQHKDRGIDFYFSKSKNL